VPAEDALQMATLNGARALGLAGSIGSLAPGKFADVISVDFNVAGCQPVHHPISQLVYSTSRDQVADVWVAGNAVVTGGRLTNDDQADVLERARAWQRRLIGDGD
jgi:5-methylthioadenosine/S-adenosylhomocysteine deaminase